MNGCLIMQIQKEEVRERILKAATEEFLEKGFQKSSMRLIAQKAGITAGNIYAYFSGKEAVLDALLTPAVQKLGQFVFEVSKGAEINELSLKEIGDSLISIFLENQNQFMVLMSAVNGTPYQKTRTYLQELVTRRIEEELMPRLAIVENRSMIANMLSAAIIEGVLLAFASYDGDEEALREQLRQFMRIMFRGFGIKE